MTIATLTERLGGTSVFGKPGLSELEFFRVIDAGLPVESLNVLLASMGELGVLQSEIFRLVGSPRTLQRKRAGSATKSPTPTRLSSAESNNLARLARVLVRAEEVLGDRAKAQRWLSKPNRAIEHTRPIDLLRNEAGAAIVDRVLGQIEHGIF